MSALDEVLNGYCQRGDPDDARIELAALRARCERAEMELNTIREMVSPLENQSLIEAIDYLLHDDSSAEVYRVDLAQVTAERDALQDALNLGQINCDGIYDDLRAERDAAREALKMYERQKAMRQ